MKKCIELLTLARYLENRMPDSDRQEVEAHLAGCERCLEEFMSADSLLRDVELRTLKVSPSLTAKEAWRKLSRKVKRSYKWISDALPLPSGIPMQPAFSAVRSQDSPVLRYRYIERDFGAFKIGLCMEKVKEESFNITVQILDDPFPRKGVRLTLIKEKGDIVSELCREGKLVFNNLSPGLYSLSSEQEARHVDEYRFEINSEGINER